MKLARFWARGADEVSSPGGRRVRAVARGWSNDSLEAARLAARATARRIGERLLGRQDAAGSAYPYGERPLPEPILREFRHDAHPDPRAVVTRNAYGALVLSVHDLMFVDIETKAGADLPLA